MLREKFTPLLNLTKGLMQVYGIPQALCRICINEILESWMRNCNEMNMLMYDTTTMYTCSLPTQVLLTETGESLKYMFFFYSFLYR